MHGWFLDNNVVLWNRRIRYNWQLYAICANKINSCADAKKKHNIARLEV